MVGVIVVLVLALLRGALLLFNDIKYGADFSDALRKHAWDSAKIFVGGLALAALLVAGERVYLHLRGRSRP